MKFFNRLAFVPTFMGLLGSNATAHDSAIHTGLATTAVDAMQQMKDSIIGPVSRVPVPPIGVDSQAWYKFYTDAGIAYSNLTTAAGDVPGGNPTKLDELLGKEAVTPDNNINDTHMWFKIDNALGLGAAKSIVDDVFKGAAGVYVVPIYCACKCVLSFFTGSHGCRDCLHDAKNLLNKVPTVSDLMSPIPGVGDIHPSAFTGLWHFINLNPLRSDDYDDHQGMLYTEAGPLGIPGTVDLLLIAMADISGMSVHAVKSDGVKNYYEPTPGDAYPDGDRYDGSVSRSKNQWQKYPFAHVPFDPVDNLALYGWKQFRGDQQLKWLGYPIHAIGDATVPMHVNGTTSWGHRPFEDAYDHLWQANKIPLDRDAIIRAAFNYRQQILAWRKGSSTDVPVRYLVRAVGRNTWDYSAKTMVASSVIGLGAWPFNDPSSLAHLPTDIGANSVTDIMGKGIDTVYEDRPDAVGLIQPLLTDGAGAILALLVSAADGQPLPAVKTAYAEYFKLPATSPRAPMSFKPQAGAAGVTRSVAIAPGAASSAAFRGSTAIDVAPADTPERQALAALAARFLLGEISQVEYTAELAKRDAEGRSPRHRDGGARTTVTNDQLATLHRLLVDQQSRGAPALQRWLSRASFLHAPQCANQSVPETPIAGRFGVGLYGTAGKAQVVLSVRKSGPLQPSCPIFFVMEAASATSPTVSVAIALRDSEASPKPSANGTLLWFTLDDNGTLPADRASFTTLIAKTGLSNVRYRMLAVNSIGDRSAWSDWQKPVSVLAP